jgi:hypothetical protein
VRLEVTDDGAVTVLVACAADAEREAGWGIQLVEALASSWRFRRHLAAMTIWLDVLALRPSARLPGSPAVMCQSSSQ